MMMMMMKGIVQL